MSDTQLGIESVFRSLRQFRERYFLPSGNNANFLPSGNNAKKGSEAYDEDAAHGALESLPAVIQFRLMKFLSPQDLCRLGGTCRYWRSVVRDPLLWRYFFVRDMPLWTSIDHTSMPRLEALDETPHDFMAEYLKSSPESRRPCTPLRPAQGIMALLRSQTLPSTPRLFMFSLGQEQLAVPVIRAMTNTTWLRVRVVPGQPRNIGSTEVWCRFRYRQIFNIVVPNPVRWEESNKVFVREGDGQTDTPAYSLTPFARKMCHEVDAFICVANVGTGIGGLEMQRAQLKAILRPRWGWSPRPVLVLACPSMLYPHSTEPRIPCVLIADKLGLQQLQNPWLALETDCCYLPRVMRGIEWLLRACGLEV